MNGAKRLLSKASVKLTQDNDAHGKYIHKAELTSSTMMLIGLEVISVLR